MTHYTGWRKSSYSGIANDNCVEVRRTPSTIGVRDSKAPAAGELWVPPSAWAAFVSTAS